MKNMIAQIVKRDYKYMPGLTLIELILTIAIVGIVITSIVIVLDLGLNSWRSYDDKAELLQNGRIAMSRIIGELRYADAASVVFSAGSLNFDTIYLIDSDSGTENIDYILTSNVLYRSVDSLNQTEVASFIDTFTITSTITGLYQIELGLSDGNNQITLKNMAYPRN